MTFKEELGRWQAALWASPDDWQLRLVIADWLDENASPGWGDIYRADSAKIREELRLEALGASKRDVCGWIAGKALDPWCWYAAKDAPYAKGCGSDVSQGDGHVGGGVE